MNAILAIAAGGALGAVMRHGVNVGAVKLLGHGFPYGTLTVNIVGSFIMGLLIAIFAHYWHPSETMRMFIVTGFLGAFTTFSTFSLDFVNLWERGSYLYSALYLGGSVILSIAGLFAAMAIVRACVS
ncbi:MAG TPA: fluoride efflux transporter CrcB [Alphaproteobacteria bacterium]|nr:fluoride efflux transporter CrcB [Alphaproteobacteria bacterium]USO04842.1 MAG: fluoride efflux transporter CrcB [Rhodospirillales bacterium]HOO80908.1 fluoride efflux transporter CrcB [Alphaproteobacteria bacterium]